MAVNVHLPSALGKLTGGIDTVQSEATTVDALVTSLEESFPGFETSLRPSGQWSRFINIYVNGEDIRFLQLGQTPLTPGQEVSIVSAMAGG